ncbi:hypothetical protein Ddc_07427 [Ditylenchus destructor]|nr:hypothetical protein Ddc_07427 [Ditylenchus destructor]
MGEVGPEKIGTEQECAAKAMENSSTAQWSSEGHNAEEQTDHCHGPLITDGSPSVTHTSPGPASLCQSHIIGKCALLIHLWLGVTSLQPAAASPDPLCVYRRLFQFTQQWPCRRRRWINAPAAHIGARRERRNLFCWSSARLTPIPFRCVCGEGQIVWVVTDYCDSDE